MACHARRGGVRILLRAAQSELSIELVISE